VVALTDEQRAAVSHGGGPLLLVGGAGTGKTHALAGRFGWLVEQGLEPERILLLAHSPATADALRRRIEETLADPYEELSVHTAQSFCTRLLRDEALEAGLDPFTVPVTAADRLAMLLERISELSLRRHDFRGSPAGLLTSFIERIDRLKDELVDPDAYARWAQSLPSKEADPAQSAAPAEREREFAEVYRAHERMLADTGALDAGDVLLGAIGLLEAKPEVAARTAGRFAHVLVDDYQDLGLAGLTLVERLVHGHGGLTAAADDDQGIDRFRGAAPRNLRGFGGRHPGAASVTLERSMRCSVPVARAAAGVVAAIEDRIPKILAGTSPAASAEPFAGEDPGAGSAPDAGSAEGEVAFWRCANERAQAQAVAADVERLITREGVAPESVAVLVRSLSGESQAVAVALEERALPHRVVGAAAFFLRAEIRDVLAWLRLLSNPDDAGAVIRALARPPMELRAVDLARCIQIARRRKLDMVSALVAATESPQIPPEARERISAFLKLYRAASGSLDTVRPDLYVHRLVERLGLRRQQLFAAQADVVERLVNLAKLAELASAYVTRAPQATAREFARYIAAVADAGLSEEEASSDVRRSAVSLLAMEGARGLEFDHVYVLGLHSARMPGGRRHATEPIADALLREKLPPDTRATHLAEMRRLLYLAMTRARRRLVLAYPAGSERGAQQQPSPFVEEARAALGGSWEVREEELFGPAETLHATFRMLRDEVLEGLPRVGGRLGELRFDTDLDIAHAVVRYLELLKLAALIERPAGQGVDEALPELNVRLLQAATPLQREVFETSALDEYLLDAERDERRRARAVAAREEPSLEAFLPKRGDGLVLSASDIETYRICPLRYKFARVFRIPTEPTLNQRFGILVHQVLERFHAAGGSHSLAELLGILDAGWRRGGFGDSDEEVQLRGKAEASLTRYHDRIQSEEAEPVWFERAFAFRMGPHLLRGRVDRVDRRPDGSHELIDYKTGRPKSAAQLHDDVQLSLYAVGAREAWQLEAAHQAYYYVLDDEKVAVRRDEADREWIVDTVHEVADGILSQGFEPTPSYAACSTCDFRIICPAAER